MRRHVETAEREGRTASDNPDEETPVPLWLLEALSGYLIAVDTTGGLPDEKLVGKYHDRWQAVVRHRKTTANLSDACYNAGKEFGLRRVT